MSTIRYQIPAILERGDVKTWTNGSYGVEPRVAGYANIPARPKTS
ncbi:hypothetical protein [Mucilaginibacter jinjuensis]|uniref:Uncharacterized protein n=1 Tax=Mucilaginibacter jinjuensis TaxID=1176721 RepID=A0ABY7TAJ3_9SPHI|nr:hypothetical protein [Mucilaginibacter jinjuensis]WCT13456.1 hypothetical protein PQO05_05850 [Mucilaginibacter jinjuensis]